jgi:hypothetical protein
MPDSSDRLYNLLPLVYRERDAAEGFPLRALLSIIEGQAGLLEQDIRTLYDDLFIETCRNWVIPYIGDLVSNRLLFDASRLPALDTARTLFKDLTGPDLRPPIAIRTRADVAKTIYFRRRKGTLPMLEELARDVSGWPAHAVEFFELLGWTQFREHLRFQSCWTDIHKVDRVDRVYTPFDETSHTVDVRRIAQQEGWHSIPNVGFFLYRLNSYLLKRVPARQASLPWRYHFSPLGHKAPLFSRWRREGDEAGLATELHVPAPVRPPFFYEDLQRYRNQPAPPDRPDFTDLYGLPDPLPGFATGVCRDCSFFILRNGQPITPTANPAAPPAVFQPQIVCRQLDPWPAAQPVGSLIAVDVASGRMAIGDGFAGATGTVDVYYHYGFAADLGGGPYERRKWLLPPDSSIARLFVQEGAPPGPNTFATVADALLAWADPLQFARANAVITILDSRTYELPGQISLRNEGFLAIEAANTQRPLLQTQPGGLEIAVLPPAVPGDKDRRAALTLNGVVVEGHLRVTGDLGRLRLLHSTLAPGRSLDEEGLPVSTAPSVEVAAGPPDDPLNAQLRIEIAFSILGSLVGPEHAEGIWLLDSIVDALSDAGSAVSGALAGPGPALTAERTTVFGQLHVRSLEMSESIATGHLETVRTQHGCVRFSYVRPGSRTPRRYRCQPDLAVKAALEAALKRNPALPAAAQAQIKAFTKARVVPAFSAVRYGQPAYAQLRLGSPIEVRTGAEDGSEMGVFSHVKQPQRESNLRIRLEEYLPFGLEAGIIYAT